jgi:hypothetical protein
MHRKQEQVPIGDARLRTAPPGECRLCSLHDLHATVPIICFHMDVYTAIDEMQTDG